MTTDLQQNIKPFIEIILNHKAMDLVILDVRQLSSVADTFIICSGRSNRQVTAISEHIRTELKKIKTQALSVEGLKDGHWVLLDYGNVVLHVFYDPIRRFYDLEGLWIDAKRIDYTTIIDVPINEIEEGVVQ